MATRSVSTLRKGVKFWLSRDVDLTKTGGPLLPKGTNGVVLKRQRDRRLWVTLDGFGTNSYFNDNDVSLLRTIEKAK